MQGKTPPAPLQKQPRIVPKPGYRKGKWPHQSVVFSSFCFSETVLGLAKQPWLGPYMGCGRGNQFKPHETQSWWPEHDAARPSHWLPGTWSQSAARANHPLSTPPLPLQKQSCGSFEVKVSLLPAAWKLQSQAQQQGHLAGLYRDVGSF